MLTERSFWLWFTAAFSFAFLDVIIKEVYISFLCPKTALHSEGSGIQNDSVFQAHNKIHSISQGGRNTEERLIAAEECKPGSSEGAAVLWGCARKGALHGTCEELMPKLMALEMFRGQRCHRGNWLYSKLSLLLFKSPVTQCFFPGSSASC